MVSERGGQVRHSLGAEQTELVSDWDEERGKVREDGWFGGPGPGGENISEAVMKWGAHRRTGGRRGRSAERGVPYIHLHAVFQQDVGSLQGISRHCLVGRKTEVQLTSHPETQGTGLVGGTSALAGLHLLSYLLLQQSVITRSLLPKILVYLPLGAWAMLVAVGGLGEGGWKGSGRGSRARSSLRHCLLSPPAVSLV